jgi:hypothetical protein
LWLVIFNEQGVLKEQNYKLHRIIILFCVAWAGFQYYTGRGNYNKEKEMVRKERVEKYGLLLIAIKILSGFGIDIDILQKC